MDTAKTNQLGEIVSSGRDKAISFFTYLKDLCALRTTQVRNVTAYDQVFWFNDLPRNKLCRCVVWRLTDPESASFEQNPDLWIEIRKPFLKSPPELPDELEPWIRGANAWQSAFGVRKTSYT